MTKPTLSPTADIMTALAYVHEGQWTIEDYAAWDATRPGKKGEELRGSIRYKVSEKGGLSVYGLQRMPVTLYADQWERLLNDQDRLKAFIVENAAALSRKQPQEAAQQAPETHAGQNGTQGPSDGRTQQAQS